MSQQSLTSNDALKQLRNHFYNNEYSEALRVMDQLSYDQIQELIKLAQLSQFNAEFTVQQVMSYADSKEFA